MRDDPPPPQAPRGALLLGALAGLTFAALCYRMILDAPRAPGDWLWNGAISANDSERVLVGGPLTDSVYRALDMASRTLTWQRIPALLAVALTVLLGAWLARKRHSVFLTPVAMLAAIGLTPLGLHDPTEVLSLTQLMAPLVVVVLCAIPVPGRAIFVGVMAGLAAPVISGVSLDVGIALFTAGCVALVTKRIPLALVAGGLQAAISFAVVASLSIEPAIQASHWWTQSSGDGSLESTAAIQALFASDHSIVLAGIGITSLLYSTPWGLLLSIATIVVAFYTAALTVPSVRLHSHLLERDSRGITDIATSASFDVSPHVLLNIPLHVRPQIVGMAGGLDKLAVHRVARTLDLGASIHVPTEWSDLFDRQPVLRWTTSGIERTTVGALLELEPVPLAGRVTDPSSDIALDPYERLRQGTLTQAFGDAVRFDEDMRAEETSRSVTVERDQSAAATIVIAVDPSARGAVDAGFLNPRSAPWRTEVRLEPEARVRGRVPGFGILVDLPAKVKKLTVHARER